MICTVGTKNTPSIIKFSGLQQKLAKFRAVRQATANGNPGTLLPLSFHGSPVKRKEDTEDALAVVNRRRKAHLVITVTCNPEWPELLTIYGMGSRFLTDQTFVAELSR